MILLHSHTDIKGASLTAVAAVLVLSLHPRVQCSCTWTVVASMMGGVGHFVKFAMRTFYGLNQSLMYSCLNAFHELSCVQ